MYFLRSSYQGSFFGVRIHFLASEGGSLHKYTNQSQSLRILQPEKRTLAPTWSQWHVVETAQGLMGRVFKK
jgi:hypothetical protein